MDIFSLFDAPKPTETIKPKSQTEILLEESKSIAFNYGVTVTDVLLTKLILILQKGD